jgi:hypothetical protein
LSSKDRPFKVGSRSEGKPLANKGITRLKHLWVVEIKVWKPMATLGLQKCLANVLNKDRIISMFLWNPNLASTIFHIRDWASPKRGGAKEIISWVYKITDINLRYLEVKKYTRETTNGLLKIIGLNKVNLPNKDLILVKVLYQDKVRETFKACEDKVDYPKDVHFWLLALDSSSNFLGILVNGHGKTSLL